MKRTAFSLLLVLPLLLGLSSCSDDDNTINPPAVNESELVVQALEGADGGYLNTTCPALITADDVYTDVYGAKKFYVMDVRATADFALGHIDGAVNVTVANALAHVKSLTGSYDKIVVVCYSGQTASFVTAILRMRGYTTAFAMKYGMSAWHSDFDKISAKVSSQYAGSFEVTDNAKPAAGNLPTLATGLSNGADILNVRVDSVLAKGFGAASVDVATVMADPSKYFIANYWPASEYTGFKHIPGAAQYTPKADLKLSTFLKTLPTNKTIVVYCYSGQTSANVAAILRVMGYDAKSLLYGASAMIWQTLKDNSKKPFEASADCKNFPYVQ